MIQEGGLMLRIMTIAAVAAVSTILMVSITFCQTTAEDDYQDVILLENGGSITGRIIERIDGEKVVIVRSDGQKFDIPWWRISLISTVDRFEEDRANAMSQPRPTSPRLTGYNYKNIIMAGVFVKDGVTITSGTMINGVLVDERLYFGLGLSWESMDRYTFVPLFVDFRRYFGDGPLIPFLYADAGYAFGTNEDPAQDNSGGVMVGLGAGVRTYISRRGSICFEAGFRRQTHKNGGGDKVSLNLLGFMAGLSFY